MEFPLFNEGDQKVLFQALNKTEVKKDVKQCYTI